MDNDLLGYAVKRSHTVLAKRTLELLEDLQSEHQAQLMRLRVNIEKLGLENGSADTIMRLIDQADYFDDDRWSRLRKRILDNSNETSREMETEMKKYKVTLG